jgi:hypothetical protein
MACEAVVMVPVVAELRRIAAGGRVLDGLDKNTAVRLRALAAVYVAGI